MHSSFRSILQENRCLSSQWRYSALESRGSAAVISLIVDAPLRIRFCWYFSRDHSPCDAQFVQIHIAGESMPVKSMEVQRAGVPRQRRGHLLDCGRAVAH